MFHSILILFSLLIFLYVFISTCYLFILALGGTIVKGEQFTVNPVKKKIAVIVPTYKEDHIIPDTAQKAARHDYPQEFFSIMVVADDLQPDTIQTLRQIPVETLEVSERMKSRSINRALEELSDRSFDIVMILDADNIMADGCLEKVNDAFHNGYKAVQCHRTAKNKHTTVALLDAISEEININLFRRGPANLGLSAAPIGSGMAFDFELIKEIFSSEEILNNPGEDREIDLELMKRKIKMEFINDALVYDEKVSSTEVFEKQRVRWLEAQVNHVKRFFHSDMNKAPKTALYFNKFFQNLLLPRILFLLLYTIVFILLLIQLILSVRILYPGPGWWLASIFLYGMTLLISIPSIYYSRETFKALLHVPVMMLSMVKALLKIKKNRKEFLHTPKSFTK
ncbi:MAG: hypothetical protein C5B59_07550 [Bacteroidetes bacterium]|nr:MAG: hypothetical protein C5B59_07550 [Bacteroidota bacterium]